MTTTLIVKMIEISCISFCWFLALIWGPVKIEPTKFVNWKRWKGTPMAAVWLMVSPVQTRIGLKVVSEWFDAFIQLKYVNVTT